MARFVVVARHGERLDYVSRDAGINWTAQATKPYDPPLTDHGKQQSEKLGRHLAIELDRLGIPPISKIYTSPFCRCRQTSEAARKGMMKTLSNRANNDTQGEPSPRPPIRVEYGLSESFNEQWFRSWSLPGADGTWGFKSMDPVNTTRDEWDPAKLHPLAQHPVQKLPLFVDWKSDTAIDITYQSQTFIANPYTVVPSQYWETRTEQCQRMKSVVDKVSRPSTTVLLISHGAPVTHLFEELTGESWKKHGKSVYCCYSVYQSVDDEDNNGDRQRVSKWEAIVVNQFQYLDETMKGDNYITTETDNQ